MSVLNADSRLLARTVEYITKSASASELVDMRLFLIHGRRATSNFDLLYLIIFSSDFLRWLEGQASYEPFPILIIIRLHCIRTNLHQDLVQPSKC